MKNSTVGNYLEVVNNLPQPIKIVIFIAVLGTLFILWKAILWAPLQNKKTETNSKIEITNKELKLLQQSIPQLQELLNKYTAAALAKSENGAQTAVIANATKPVTAASPQMVAQTLRSLLNTKQNLTLVNFEAEPTTVTTDAATQQKIFEHGITINLEGNYFGIINYIENIEALNWPIYWDRLEYSVDKYPDAKIQLQIHTLSQREEANYDTIDAPHHTNDTANK